MKDGLIINVSVPNHRRHPENKSDLEQAVCTIQTFNEIADKCKRIVFYDGKPAKVVRIEIIGDSNLEKFKLTYLQNGREVCHEYTAKQFHNLT